MKPCAYLPGTPPNVTPAPVVKMSLSPLSRPFVT